MKKIKVKYCGCGFMTDSYRVNLPTYIDFEIITVDPPVASIEVPDDEVDINNGIVTLSKSKIRQKYRGQKWDNPTVIDDVII